MIKQTKTGLQEKRYGDHIYEWVAEKAEEFTPEKIKELVGNALPYTEYIEKYRSKLPFNEHMEIICRGWWKLLTPTILRKQQEYID